MARASDKRSEPGVQVRGDADPGAVAGDGSSPSELGIDEILDRLEGVVRDLEGGELPLERALERFELGVRLARKGGLLLDRVEQRVEMLLAERDEVVPFAPAGSDDEERP
ncbi:MAG: exodeoxyribonuclease VII small subunit [Deltaproteobacteria bacterium]|nr:exodeoxyribonuclease VII small subunit [Nannocystaceae bacterium]